MLSAAQRDNVDYRLYERFAFEKHEGFNARTVPKVGVQTLTQYMMGSSDRKHKWERAKILRHLIHPLYEGKVPGCDYPSVKVKPVSFDIGVPNFDLP